MLLGSSRPFSWLILEENGHKNDDDDDTTVLYCCSCWSVDVHVYVLFQAILDRTGYSLDVTTGQRKYGGPPPNWDGSPPGSGHEVSLLMFQSIA